ncbi:YbgS-like family protein, partial [Salmonella enterica]
LCKPGRGPYINKKVETGNGVNNDVNTKTDGTTQ